MAYITLNEAKTFLGITDTSQDSSITQMIPIAKWMTDQIIWNLESSDKTETINLCSLQYYYWIHLYLKNIEVTAIKSIDWITYTGVLGTDYKIIWENKRKIRFDNLEWYLENVNWFYFDVVYTSWFAVIPENIKLLQYLLIWWMLSKENWKEVESIMLWDVSMTFKKDDIFTWKITINYLTNLYKIYSL